MTTQTKVKMISVDLDTNIQKKDGGTYTGTEMVYEDSYGIKKKGIPSTQFKFNETLKTQLVNLKESGLPKDVVLVTEKKGDFVNVTGVLPGDTPIETSTDVKPQTSGLSGGGYAQLSTNTKSNTFQGRDAVNMNRADALAAAARVGGTTTEVLERAEVFNKYLKGE